MSWFPRFNRLGEIVTEQHVPPLRYQAQWLATDRTIWHDGAHLFIDGQEQTMQAFNEIGAGGGVWAGAVVTASPFILLSWNGEVIHGAANPTISPDGRYLAYIADRQTSPRIVLRIIATAHEVELDRGAVTDLRVSNLCAVWTKSGRTWGHWFGVQGSRDINVAPAEFRPIPIDVGDVPWVLNHTHTGIIVRPFAEAFGYRFDNGGQTFYPDGMSRFGSIEAAFTDSNGVLDRRGWSLTAPRVDLRPPVVVPDPDPDPDPEEPVEYPRAEWRIVEQMHARFAADFPATEDGAREWTRRTIQQLKFSFPAGGWCWKSGDPSRPPSKDCTARRIDGRFEGWDVLAGAGVQGPRVLAPYPPQYHDLAGQHPIDDDRVAAFNYLGGIIVPDPNDVSQAIKDYVNAAVAASEARSKAYTDTSVDALATDLDAVTQRVQVLENAPPAEGFNPEEWRTLTSIPVFGVREGRIVKR